MTDYYILASDSEAQNQVALSTQGATAGNFVRDLLDEPGRRGSAPFLEWQMPTTDLFDWPWNSTGATLLSERARSVIEPLVGSEDHIQWIPASLLTPAGASMPYWVAHFYAPLDAYHDGLTDRGPSGIPYQWTLSLSKAAGHHVFTLPYRGNMVILSAAAAAAVSSAKLTGVTLKTCVAA